MASTNDTTSRISIGGTQRRYIQDRWNPKDRSKRAVFEADIDQLIRSQTLPRFPASSRPTLDTLLGAAGDYKPFDPNMVSPQDHAVTLAALDALQQEWDAHNYVAYDIVWHSIVLDEADAAEATARCKPSFDGIGLLAWALDLYSADSGRPNSP